MIKVLSPGMLTTVQDMGRIHYQNQGVSVAGAMDTFALQVANALINNPLETAGLEITLTGFSCEFLSDTMIALTGANLGYTLNNTPVAMYQTLYITKGDILKITQLVNGFRGYMSIRSGFNLKPIMGSLSTDLKGGFGGFEGRKLKAGDVLALKSQTQGPLKVKRTFTPPKNQSRLNLVLGPDETHFDTQALHTLTNSTYTLTPQSDRMGLRFTGPTIHHTSGPDILSSALTFGSVQIPGDGHPIIMAADRQATGGYTLIGTVASIDHTTLAQLKPGDQVTFKIITQSQAIGLLKAKHDHLAQWISQQSTDTYPQNKRHFKITVNNHTYQLSVTETSE